MTKEELYQLTWLKAEIKRDKERLAALERRLAAGKPGRIDPFDGMPRSPGGADVPAGCADEIAALHDRIEARILRCWQELNRLCRFIDGVEDSLMRQILTLRFVEGRTWNGVADVIGGGNTEGSVKMACARFLSAGGGGD